jgi:hypothetical protein
MHQWITIFIPMYKIQCWLESLDVAVDVRHMDATPQHERACEVGVPFRIHFDQLVFPCERRKRT